MRLQVRWNRWRSSTARTASARRRGRPPRAPRRTGGGDDQERGVRRAEQIDRGGSDDQAEQRAAARSAEDEQLGAGAEVEEQSGGLLLLDHPLDLDLRVDDGPRREGVGRALAAPGPSSCRGSANRGATGFRRCPVQRPTACGAPVDDDHDRAVRYAINVHASPSRTHKRTGPAATPPARRDGRRGSSEPRRHPAHHARPFEVADHRAGLEEPQRSMSGTTVRRTPLW